MRFISQIHTYRGGKKTILKNACVVMLRVKPFNKKFSFTIENQFKIYMSFDKDNGDVNPLFFSLMHFN